MEENNSKKTKGYDPGWNDPPTLAYSPAISKTKNNLNKRVAFPLQSASNQNSPITSSGSKGLPIPFSNVGNTNIYLPPTQNNELPPLVSTFPPPPPPSISLVTNKSTDVSNEVKLDENLEDVKEVTREYCLNVFDKIIAEIPINNNVEEIKKRINLMNCNWLELSPQIQNNLKQISKALENKNINEANALYRSLVVDNVGEKNIISQLCPALRQLIVSIEEPIKSTESMPIDDNNIPMFNDTLPLNSLITTENKSDSKKNFSKIYHI